MTHSAHPASAHRSDPHPSSVTRRAVVWMIRTYQLARAGHVSPCRFTPTCSEYAVQAFSLHGTRRGLGLVARRLLRCRPRGPFGYDPVPPASE